VYLIKINRIQRLLRAGDTHRFPKFFYSVIDCHEIYIERPACCPDAYPFQVKTQRHTL